MSIKNETDPIKNEIVNGRTTETIYEYYEDEETIPPNEEKIQTAQISKLTIILSAVSSAAILVLIASLTCFLKRRSIQHPDTTIPMDVFPRDENDSMFSDVRKLRNFP
jgi:hypothetical protein